MKMKLLHKIIGRKTDYFNSTRYICLIYCIFLTFKVSLSIIKYEK